MSSYHRILTIALLALTVGVVVVNIHYLYVAPVANTWVWWSGDETWLMAQYKEFVTTAHYLNPLAPGSAFAHGSGLLFGSCYLSAILYGLPLLLVKGHTIDTGRTVTYLLGVVTLVLLWQIAKRYRVEPPLRAFGCLLLSSTLCFFISSHSARYDLLVGLTILILVGYLPVLSEKKPVASSVLLGSLVPLTMLVNGHVLILLILTIAYMVWRTGILKSKRSSALFAGTAIAGLLLLLSVQASLIGTLSLLGPFKGNVKIQPLFRFFHPKYQIANYYWRYSTAYTFAPGVLAVAIVLTASLVWARFRYKFQMSRLEPLIRIFLMCASLVVASSLYIEFVLLRYFIFVLPMLVLTFVIMTSELMRVLPGRSKAVLSVALGACVVLALSRFSVDALRIGRAGEAISAANGRSVTEALEIIHARHPGHVRVFCTNPVQNIAMDDSCLLITPLMYDQPSAELRSRHELWESQKLDYAIVCSPANGCDDWKQTDSSIDWGARMHAKVVFQALGAFSDINRAYAPSDSALVDTLRVYEFCGKVTVRSWTFVCRSLLRRWWFRSSSFVR